MSAAEDIQYDHELKVWPQYFWPISEGRKPFEVRRDDRGFQTGQVLWLREFKPNSRMHDRHCYTGNAEFARITYILTGGQFGVEPGHVVMGLDLITDDDIEEDQG